MQRPIGGGGGIDGNNGGSCGSDRDSSGDYNDSGTDGKGGGGGHIEDGCTNGNNGGKDREGGGGISEGMLVRQYVSVSGLCGTLHRTQTFKPIVQTCHRCGQTSHFSKECDLRHDVRHMTLEEEDEFTEPHTRVQLAAQPQPRNQLADEGHQNVLVPSAMLNL
jgi:hypothetical protein